MNGSVNKVNGNASGLVLNGSSEPRRTALNEIQMRSAQPPDVVSSQRRRNDKVVTSVDDDSLEAERPVGVDNPGYAEDSGSDVLGPMERRPYDGWVTPTFADGDVTRRSPTRLQYVPPSSRSPVQGLVVPAPRGRRSVTPSTSSQLPRNPPTERPTSAPGPGRRRRTPVGGLDDVYEEEPDTTAPTMMARGRVLTPTVGLTVEEVDRITDSRRCTPAAAAAAHSSTSSTGRGSSPDLVNRTDFTRDDLELVARPRSTPSDDDDETRDETFTCSEYDCAGRRRPPQPMLDFANAYRLRAAPTLALPPPPLPSPRRSVTPNDRGGPPSSSSSTVDETFSVDDRSRAAPAALQDGIVDLGRVAAELGWKPDFDVLAEIFVDLAALSDAGRSTAVAGGRSPLASPVRSTPPNSHRSAAGSSAAAAARGDTPSSRTRSPPNQPPQRLASPAERLAGADGRRSLSPSAQTARQTPLDGVQRRTPAILTPPSYMPPPVGNDRRWLKGTSSPRDGVASPRPGATSPPRQGHAAATFSANSGRDRTPRGTPRPVLEEYV